MATNLPDIPTNLEIPLQDLLTELKLRVESLSREVESLRADVTVLQTP